MARFYIENNQGTLNIKLQSDATVNAWSGAVAVKGPIQNAKILTAGGVTELWQEPPHWNGNEIDFTGGKPNGFSGEGTLFQIILGNGDYQLSFAPQTAAYLNDGLGTKAPVILESLVFDGRAETLNLAKDTEPPEPFTPTLYQEKDFFDNKPVAMFSASDRDSGVNHYEVREITEKGSGFFKEAQSPYLINGDVKTLEIKAVDNFGNERIETLNVKSGTSDWYSIILILAGFAALAFIVYNIRRWIRKII